MEGICKSLKLKPVFHIWQLLMNTANMYIRQSWFMQVILFVCLFSLKLHLKKINHELLQTCLTRDQEPLLELLRQASEEYEICVQLHTLDVELHD